MPDKTYTAADFATARFAARSEDYHAGVAMRCDLDASTPWRSLYGAWRDDQMADAGFSPVRECPDPEVHEPVSDRLERESRESKARSWEAVTTHPAIPSSLHIPRGVSHQQHVLDRLTELANAEARAEEAERELRQARSERDELRSLYEGQIEVIGRLQHAAESRPLGPDAIEERVERAEEAYHRAHRENRPDALRVAVLAALTERIARAAATSEGFGPGHPDHEVVVGEYLSDAQFLAPFIADEVRKAKAEAWDRAYWQGVQDEIDSQGFDGGMTGPNRLNPYRETGDSDGRR